MFFVPSSENVWTFTRGNRAERIIYWTKVIVRSFRIFNLDLIVLE